MLNISEQNVSSSARMREYPVFAELDRKYRSVVFLRVLYVLLGFVIVILFLPWTQNIRSKGFVTALKPGQRPQTIQSVISGRIERWFVQEGQQVKKGDTIVYISEVKEEYLDPDLLKRTQKQLETKELSVRSYANKLEANDRQIDALLDAQQLKNQQLQNKLRQAHLKVVSDSADLAAAGISLRISREQLSRIEELHKSGLKSLTEVEGRRLKYQEAMAKYVSIENKLLTSRNELINAQLELGAIQAEYNDKVSKSEAEKFTTISTMMEVENEVVKLQNKITNYSIRSAMYYILAPQDGYITRAIKSGVGETVKEGAELVSIMPGRYELAVEMYVEPMDIPLLALNQQVMVQFDGWPAIVFSGWPGTSFGTYSGRVVAIDNFTGESGKYRVLVGVDENAHPWPDKIRLGAGARTITLLNDVPVWYELWRRINGFPPDYYTTPGAASEKEKTTK